MVPLVEDEDEETTESGRGSLEVLAMKEDIAAAELLHKLRVGLKSEPSPPPHIRYY